MERTLLIGNGFNQISDGGASWDELLNQLAGKATTLKEKNIRKAKPFTLWFEEMASRSNKKDLKQRIASFLKRDLSPNHHHVDAMKLDVRHVFTTNYDYTLEESTGKKRISNHSAPETYYSLFRRSSSGDRHIWHIHGELDNVRSIMLGHEQYSGYIHKIRNYLTSGVPTDVRDRKGKPYLSKFSPKRAPQKGDVETWVDLFLEHEVHVVGFSLDYTENHLWNLIIEKERLKRREASIGTVVFHRCSDHEQGIEDEARLSILSALGVEVVDHTESTYSKAYDRCIRSLR
jgi:hypothetical protein